MRANDPDRPALEWSQIQALVRDLARLARAQARVTHRLSKIAAAIDLRAGSEPPEPARVARLAGGAGGDVDGAEAAEPAVPGGKEDAGEQEPAQPDVADDSTVLVLESGEAKVGVLWEQVTQVGSNPAGRSMSKIDADGGEVELVSLGRLLHGEPGDERSFVVLEENGDRLALMCEKLLGLGPLHSVHGDVEGSHLQILRVPLLKRLAQAGGGSPAAQQDADRDPTPRPAHRDEEETDRKGPLRALVAVRYLPARVAICRHLRGRGWQVGEAAGLEAAAVSLDLGHWDALFLEARSSEETAPVEEDVLRRVGERGIPLVRVGSRLSGFPQGGAPSVIFPFADAEIDAILASVGAR